MGAIIYFLAYYFPFWGLPTAYILFEVGNNYRKRGLVVQGLFFVGLSFLFLVASILFFVFSGFDTVVPAIKSLEHKYL